MSPGIKLEERLSGTLSFAREMASFQEWLPFTPKVEATIYGFKNNEGRDQTLIVKGFTDLRSSKIKPGDTINIFKYSNGLIVIEARSKDTPFFLSHYYQGFPNTTSEYG